MQSTFPCPKCGVPLDALSALREQESSCPSCHAPIAVKAGVADMFGERFGKSFLQQVHSSGDESSSPFMVNVRCRNKDGVDQIIVRTNPYTLTIICIALALVSWNTWARYTKGEMQYFEMFVTANIGLLLVVLITLINKTTLTVDRESLRVTYGPIAPFSRERQFAGGEISHLAVSQSRQSSFDSEGATQWILSLDLTTRSGQTYTLLSRQTENVTRYVERRLRNTLVKVTE